MALVAGIMAVAIGGHAAEGVRWVTEGHKPA
jgi:hypothetical protein